MKKGTATIFLSVLFIILLLIIGIFFFNVFSGSKKAANSEFYAIANQAVKYCLAIKNEDTNLCNNLSLMSSGVGISMRDECIKNIVLKKMSFEKINYCSLGSGTNLSLEECNSIFSVILDPSLDTNSTTRQMWIAFNKADFNLCNNTADSDFCNLILNSDYDCNIFLQPK